VRGRALYDVLSGLGIAPFVARYGLYAGIQFLGGTGLLPFTTMSIPPLGHIQPHIQWVLGILLPGVKWLGHIADPSPPCIAKVKNGCGYFHSPIYLYGMVLS
jgi:hypothetical protein